MGNTPESTLDYVVALIIAIVILLFAAAVVVMIWVQRKDIKFLQRQNRQARRSPPPRRVWFTGPDRWWMLRRSNRHRP